MTLKSIVFTTVHKGASSFIADQLARYLVASEHFDTFLPVGSMRIRGTETTSMTDWPATGLVAVRIYPAEFRDLRSQVPNFRKFARDAALVFMQRDPRDAAVSLFYSKAFSHSENVMNKERFLKDREQLQAMSPREGVAALTAAGAIAEFSKLHQLCAKHDGLMTRYEDLVTDPVGWFQKVGEFSEWPQSLIEQVQLEFKDSFTPPDVADPMQHKRRITPGNWREVFDEELEQEFDAKIGTRLRANGYT